MTICNACGISPALCGPAELSHLCRTCRNTRPDAPQKRVNCFARSRHSSNRTRIPPSIPPLTSTPTVGTEHSQSKNVPAQLSKDLLTQANSKKGSSTANTSSPSSSSSSDADNRTQTASLTSLPPSPKPLARTISIGTELVELRKKRLRLSSPARRQLPLSCGELDVTIEDSLSKDFRDHKLTDESRLYPGFATLTSDPQKGRHWPGRDIVLAVRNALLLGMDPVFETSTLSRKRHRLANHINERQVRRRKKYEALQTIPAEMETTHLPPELRSSFNDSHKSPVAQTVRHSQHSYVRTQAPDRVEQRNITIKRPATKLVQNLRSLSAWPRSAPREKPSSRKPPLPKQHIPTSNYVHRDNKIQTGRASHPGVMSRPSAGLAFDPSTPLPVVRPIGKRQVPNKEAFRPKPQQTPLSLRAAFPHQYQRSRPQELQQGPNNSQYRALPLTSWPQPRNIPRLSSYTFASVFPRREKGHASGGAPFAPQTPPNGIFNNQVRQEIAGWRDLRPCKPPRPKLFPPSSSGRVEPLERRQINARLFSHQQDWNKREMGRGSRPSPYRSDTSTLRTSVIPNRIPQRKLVFSGPTNVLHGGSEPCPRPRRPQKSSLDTKRKQLLTQRLLEVRKKKAEKMAEAKHCVKRTIPVKSSHRMGEVEAGSARQGSSRRKDGSFPRENFRNCTQNDIHGPFSPVTSSGERMRTSFVEPRHKWKERLSRQVPTPNRRQGPQNTSSDMRNDVCNPVAFVLAQGSAKTSFATKEMASTRPSVSLRKSFGKERPVGEAKTQMARRWATSRDNENKLQTAVQTSGESGPKEPVVVVERDNLSHSAYDVISVKSLQERNTAPASLQKVLTSKSVSRDVSSAIFSSPCSVSSPSRLMSSPVSEATRKKTAMVDLEATANAIPVHDAGRTQQDIIRNIVSAPEKKKTFIVKASCRYGWANSTRRLSVSMKTAFPAFKTRLGDAFDMIKPFTITYRDEEGDFVKVSSEAEMAHLLNMAGRHVRPVQVKLIPPHGLFKTSE